MAEKNRKKTSIRHPDEGTPAIFVEHEGVTIFMGFRDKEPEENVKTSILEILTTQTKESVSNLIRL